MSISTRTLMITLMISETHKVGLTHGLGRDSVITTMMNFVTRQPGGSKNIIPITRGRTLGTIATDLLPFLTINSIINVMIRTIYLRITLISGMSTMLITGFVPPKVVKVITHTSNVGIVLLWRRGVLGRHLDQRYTAQFNIRLIAVCALGSGQLTIGRGRLVCGLGLTRTSTYESHRLLLTIGNGSRDVRVQLLNVPGLQHLGNRVGLGLTLLDLDQYKLRRDTIIVRRLDYGLLALRTRHDAASGNHRLGYDVSMILIRLNVGMRVLGHDNLERQGRDSQTRSTTRPPRVLVLWRNTYKPLRSTGYSSVLTIGVSGLHGVGFVQRTTTRTRTSGLTIGPGLGTEISAIGTSTGVTALPLGKDNRRTTVGANQVLKKGDEHVSGQGDVLSVHVIQALMTLRLPTKKGNGHVPLTIVGIKINGVLQDLGKQKRVYGLPVTIGQGCNELTICKQDRKDTQQRAVGTRIVSGFPEGGFRDGFRI